MTLSSVFRTIAHKRVSTFKFLPNKSIPTEIINDILDVTLTSPSSFNLQPSHVLLLRSQLSRQTLSHCMLGPANQDRAKSASLLAIFLSDLHLNSRIDRISQLEKLSKVRSPRYLANLPIMVNHLIDQSLITTCIKNIISKSLSPLKSMSITEPIQAWSYKNTSLLVSTFVYAATSHELQTCIMEGFDAKRIKEKLLIPNRYAVPCVVAVGYGVEEESASNCQSIKIKRTPRLDKKEVFWAETFGKSWDKQLEEEKNNCKS